MIDKLELFELLQPFAEQKSQIRLLNIFKGLPITHEATIKSVSDSEIIVNCDRYQLACLYNQRETYIQSNELPFTLRAQVLRINLTKEEASLSDFEIAQSDIGNRMNIRVIPGDQLVGIFQIQGNPTKVIAPIADISNYGISVYINELLFPIKLFQTGDDVNLTIAFPEKVSSEIKKELLKQISATRNSRRVLRTIRPPTIPHGNMSINAWGKILAIRSEKKSFRHRVSMKLYIKDSERLILTKYISVRQAEIIQDLRFLAEDLFNSKT